MEIYIIMLNLTVTNCLDICSVCMNINYLVRINENLVCVKMKSNHIWYCVNHVMIIWLLIGKLKVLCIINKKDLCFNVFLQYISYIKFENHKYFHLNYQCSKLTYRSYYNGSLSIQCIFPIWLNYKILAYYIRIFGLRLLHHRLDCEERLDVRNFYK